MSEKDGRVWVVEYKSIDDHIKTWNWLSFFFNRDDARAKMEYCRDLQDGDIKTVTYLRDGTEYRVRGLPVAKRFEVPNASTEDNNE